jgi:hypothetical protein
MKRCELEDLRNRVERNLRGGTPSSFVAARAIMCDNFKNLLYYALELTEPKPKEAHTMGDNYPADMPDEPCSYCLGASEKAEGIISGIDTAVGMITVASMTDETIAKAKEILMKASMDVGEIYE